jgi:hypothetical protein
MAYKGQFFVVRRDNFLLALRGFTYIYKRDYVRFRKAMDKFGLQRFTYKPKDACWPKESKEEPLQLEPGPSRPRVLLNILI